MDPSAFEENRRRLWGVAYRMLGSRADAEDMVQETYLRWHRAPQEEVRAPQAWLVTTITRLCINRLRQVRAERETYVGPWLPEPLVDESMPPPEEAAELASDLSVAFLAVLEGSRPKSARRSCCTRCSTRATTKSRRFSARTKRRAARS